MRIKVVGMYDDGELGCLTDNRQINYVRVPRENLIDAIGVVFNADCLLTNQDVFALLKDKEFTAYPVIDRIIPSCAKLCETNNWNFHEISCVFCGSHYCICGENYVPVTTE
jgi:hypothetical protein